MKNQLPSFELAEFNDDLKKLIKSVHNTKERGAPHDQPFKVKTT